MTITENPVDNGVNVEAILGAREAISGTREAGAFTWRRRRVDSRFFFVLFRSPISARIGSGRGAPASTRGWLR